MVLSKRLTLVRTTLAAVGLAACSSHDTSAPTGLVGPQAFAPTRDTTLAGTVQFTTLSIPAGVTVTASAALTIETSGTAQIAGSLVAPCFPLSLLGGSTVVVTGKVSTSCASPPASPPQLLILADSGYTLQGAQIIASGALSITTDTTLTDVGFPQSTLADLSTARSGSAADAKLAGGVCTVASTLFTADPPSAADGAPGSPQGGNGIDGHPWALSCTGELDLAGGIQVTGQSGGNGGTGTSSTAATAVGGNGGKGGTLRVRAAGPMVLAGTNSLASGNGGNGAAGIATPTTVGTTASAKGGIGGDVTGSSGSNGPVDVRAKGPISISGTLSIVVGHGGAGGPATATGVNGPPGAAGSAAIATGGSGGNSSPYGLAGSNVSGLGNARVSGGNGGAGGKATAAAGNGGTANTPGGAGGPGGPNTATGGNGGNAQVKDQNGNLVGTGGAAGSVEFDAANGGVGAAGCPNAGGPGGIGGSAAGHPGVVGTGTAPGAAGSTLLNGTGNGAKGGDGNGPGAGGNAGTDATPAPKTANGTNFTPGLAGQPCPTSSRTIQLINGDVANEAWGLVAYGVNGSALNPVTPTGNLYKIDLTGVPDSAQVRIVIASILNLAKRIRSWDATAGYFVGFSGGASFTNPFGGVPTGTVKVTQNGVNGYENVVVGSNSAQLTATTPTASIRAPLGILTVVSQAAGALGSLPASGSVRTATLADQMDISDLLSLGKLDVVEVTPPDRDRYMLLYSRNVTTADALQLDLWGGLKSANYGYLRIPGTPATTEDAPVTPQANMPSQTLQALATGTWTTSTTYLGSIHYAVSPKSYNALLPPAGPQPVVTSPPGAGLTIAVVGQTVAPYNYSEIHHSVTVNGTTYQIDAYNNTGSNSFTWTTPFVSGFSAPSGAGGAWTLETSSNDPFKAPSDGDVVSKAGLMGYFGTPPLQTISVTGPSVVSVPMGGCTSVTINVTGVGLTNSIFMGFAQTAGASGAATVSPAHPVIQPGSPPANSLSFCAASGVSGGTANIEIAVASLGLAGLVSATTVVPIVIH